MAPAQVNVREPLSASVEEAQYTYSGLFADILTTNYRASRLKIPRTNVQVIPKDVASLRARFRALTFQLASGAPLI